MLCERCKKNEAVFYYRENVNGQEKKYSLCRDCAEELKKSGELKFGDDMIDTMFSKNPFGEAFEHLDSLFGSLFEPAKEALPNGSQGGAAQKHCPTCGATLADIAKTGRVGCPDCYAEFEKELMPTIGRIHGCTKHTGRAPKEYREQMEKKRRIETLEAEQKEAIAAENYERAAEIRDELKTLR